MIRRLPLFLLAALGSAFAACGGGGGSEGETGGSGIKVVATTTQIGALTREVSGGLVELSVLLTAGSDAHDYEPDPSAIRRIAASQLLLRHGLGLDNWLDSSIESAGGSKLVVTVSEGATLAPGARASAGEGENDEEFDPHIWQDVDNAKVMVDNIVRALSEADGPNAATFAANGAAYKAKLDATDVEVRRILATIPPGNRKLVTNHDAFGYFIRRYDLQYVGAIIPSTQKDAQPSAREIAELQDLIKKEGVRAIFAEEEIDPKVAREIAKDTNLKIVDTLYADSLGKKGSGAETIDGMLLYNARAIAEALK